MRLSLIIVQTFGFVMIRMTRRFSHWLDVSFSSRLPFIFISSIPAALSFTRVLIVSSSSCKVNSSGSKDLCSFVLYLEYGIPIFDCFFITCVLPFLISTCATWFAVTSYWELGLVGSLEILRMLCHAFRLFWVKSVDSTKSIHFSCCTAARCTTIDSPSSMVSSLKGFSLNLFWYLSYRSFVSFVRPGI